eukprot:gene19-12832_t
MMQSSSVMAGATRSVAHAQRPVMAKACRSFASVGVTSRSAPRFGSSSSLLHSFLESPSGRPFLTSCYSTSSQGEGAPTNVSTPPELPPRPAPSAVSAPAATNGSTATKDGASLVMTCILSHDKAPP